MYQVGATCFITRAIRRAAGYQVLPGTVNRLRCLPTLRTAPARDSAGPASGCKFTEKIFDQGGFADARLARDTQQQPTTSHCMVNAGAQLRPLFLTTDSVSL